MLRFRNKVWHWASCKEEAGPVLLSPPQLHWPVCPETADSFKAAVKEEQAAGLSSTFLSKCRWFPLQHHHLLIYTAQQLKTTTENSHAIYPPKGKKGKQRETFMRKENESARRALQRVRHSDGTAGDKEERGRVPAWSLPSSIPTISPLQQLVQRHKPLRIYCMFLLELHFHI